MRTVIVALCLGLSACDAPDSNSAPSTEIDPNPRIDSDATPSSGSGGESQTVSPDGTTSTTQKAVPNQPNPTD